MEKKLLRSYNRVFMGELAVYGLFFSTVCYLGASIVSGKMNVKLVNSMFLVPGLVSSISSYYFRAYHNRSFEGQLKSIYQDDLKMYHYFFRDSGFHDDEDNDDM